MAATASPDQASSFVEDLTKPQRKIFGELQELLAHQESNLDWYHCTGTKLLELQEAIAKREPGWTRALAAALGASTSTLTKMRKFAADFTRRQAQRLDELGCNWGMVTVVQHARTADRMKLLEQALEKNWNVTELHAVVKQRFGVHHPGGRPLRRPRSMKDGLVQLQALGEKWLRFYDVLAGGDRPLQDQWRDLSPKDMQRLAALLPGVRNTIRKMQQSALAVDKLLGELERKARRS